MKLFHGLLKNRTSALQIRVTDLSQVYPLRPMLSKNIRSEFLLPPFKVKFSILRNEKKKKKKSQTTPK